jgi:hypothetical protein
MIWIKNFVFQQLLYDEGAVWFHEAGSTWQPNSSIPISPSRDW